MHPENETNNQTNSTHQLLMAKLKPLLLPQLVEERRKRESIAEMELDLSASCYTQNSSPSETPSPVTPTFSTRGHLRYPTSSSVSSSESSYHSPLVDSPSSPTFFSNKPGKRSLPDVQEEPHEKEDLDMFDNGSELYDCLCKSIFTVCFGLRRSLRGHV